MLRYLAAAGGKFVYEDHQVPWSVTAPNIDPTSTNLPKYPRQRHVPWRHRAGPERSADVSPLQDAVHARRPKVHLDRIDLTRRARTVGVGRRGLRALAKQIYRVKSRCSSSGRRDLLKDEKWDHSRRRRFADRSACTKAVTSGARSQPQTGVNELIHFPNLRVAPLDAAGVRSATPAPASTAGGRRSLILDQAARPADRPIARFDASVSGADPASLTQREPQVRLAAPRPPAS